MSPSAPSRLSRLARAAIPAAPLALVGIPSARAVIVYTNPADQTITLGGSNKLFVDMGTAGGTGSISTSTFGAADFSLKIYSTNRPYVRVTGASGNFLTETSSYRLSRLGSGVTLDQECPELNRKPRTS